MIDLNFKQIEEINQDEPGTSGNVYHSLPLEFFVHSPLIMKFMFFKWGYYFVQSDEYNNFSQWKLPPRLSAISEKYNDIYNFQHVFYIWDSSLIWALSKEISNFYKTHIISEQEKEDIKNELKLILSQLEKTLNGTRTPSIPFPPETDFLVSSINVGFSSSYFFSGNRHLALFQTNFSFSMIQDSEDNFNKIKEWINSLCHISTLLSRSGRIERRLFFNTQYRIIDEVLK